MFTWWGGGVPIEHLLRENPSKSSSMGMTHQISSSSSSSRTACWRTTDPGPYPSISWSHLPGGQLRTWTVLSAIRSSILPSSPYLTSPPPLGLPKYLSSPCLAVPEPTRLQSLPHLVALACSFPHTSKRCKSTSKVGRLQSTHTSSNCKHGNRQASELFLCTSTRVLAVERREVTASDDIIDN